MSDGVRHGRGVHGGPSGAPLHFAPGNIQGVRLEMKYCELCAGTFLREVSGVPSRATCGRCLKAAERRLLKEARELTMARSLGQPTKMMPQ